ncbi:ABC transporter permease [Teredinibacter haidensis]|uniref:ABC transporter permease n=1 Tax=Teredinibacter haidensis TaxID=2731755 RepID=UPI0009490BC9|nr:ABC transporter permease [Teredinibacter haidensis]
MLLNKPFLKDSLSEYEAGRSLSQDAYVRLKKNKLAIAGLIFLVVIVTLALLAPLIAPYSYEAQNLDLGATPPSLTHWMGTDIFGRDQLTRILYGSRVSLMVGIVATAVALLIGVLWGTTAGYLGGKTDAVMMRIVDILYALPFTIFIILLTVVFGRSIFLLFLAIGAVEWLTMARIVRGQVMALKHQEFIEAAISMGLNRWQIMTRHLIPNILGPVIVYTTLTIPSVILLESFLSFLGLGIQPPQSSWGALISNGVETIEEYPWLILYPSLFLSFTLFALNFLGDGLRDAFDPRTSKD